jgi:excisionase family DNA binding protein
MLTLKEYAFVEGDTAAAIGLEPDGEYGLLMREDEHGRRVTVVGDANYTQMIRDAPHHVVAIVRIHYRPVPTPARWLATLGRAGLNRVACMFVTMLELATRYLTIAELADRLGVDHRVIRRAIREGQLKAYQLGGSRGPYRLDPDDVDTWLLSVRVEPKPDGAW